MSAAWVAGSIRARAMTRRRLGRAGARALAQSPGLEAAVAVLTNSAYGHGLRPGATLEEAQRAAVAAVVWNARVLAGWMPRDGVTILRVLFGAVEAANVTDHLTRLAGGSPPEPLRLGGLASAWPRLSRTRSPEELRRALARSPWGDPGGATAQDLGPAMATVWADRVIAAVPCAAPWAAGATALLVGRTTVLQHQELPPRARMAAERVLGRAALEARTLDDLRRLVPTMARWALADVDDPEQLWRADARWWSRIDRDGRAMVRSTRPGPDIVVGAIAMMAADAWRVRAALEVAVRGGRSIEVLDEVA